MADMTAILPYLTDTGQTKQYAASKLANFHLKRVYTYVYLFQQRTLIHRTDRCTMGLSAIPRMPNVDGRATKLNEQKG